MAEEIPPELLEKAKEYLVHPVPEDVTDLPQKAQLGDVEIIKGETEDYKFDLERQEAIQREEVTKQHTDYLESHPELKQIIGDMLSAVLMDKPSNVYEYFADYFSGTK